MALINSTYFVGDRHIPNTDKPEILERLNWFINKFEPKLLRDILGYALYKSFIAGLQEVVVADKWLDILYGSDYTYNGKLKRYFGLLEVDDSINPGVFTPDDINFTADSTNVSTGEYHNAFLEDKVYRVVQRGVGPLEETTEVVYLTDGFSKVSGFELGEKFTIEFLESTPLPTASGVEVSEVKQSLIADFVYWNFLQDQQTQTVGLGEVKAKGEMSNEANPALKLVTAWNEMSNKISSLQEFLQVNKETYPDWTYDQKCKVLYEYRENNLWGF